MNRPPQLQRQTALLILFAFSTLPLLLLFATWRTLGVSGTTPILGMILSAAAAVGAIVLSLSRLKTELEPQRFQTEMLICLAVSELAALLGIFLAGPGSPSAAIGGAVASVVIDLLFIAPRVLAYWQSRC